MTDLKGVAAEVQDRVGYIRIQEPRRGEEGWHGCAALIDDHRALRTAALAGERGTDQMVAASLFVQSYAFKVAAVPVAAFALGLPVPLPHPKDMQVRTTAGRVKGVHYEETAGLAEPHDAGALAGALFQDHLQPMTQAVRHEVRLGEKLVWGNVAASVATAFRAIEGAARDRRDEREREAIRGAASVFFTASEQWTAGTGRFEVLGDGWYWTRTSCCLYYRQSDGRRCDDCSLYTAEELRELRGGQ